MPRSMLFCRSRFEKTLDRLLSFGRGDDVEPFGFGACVVGVMISIWSPLLICVVIGSILWLILAPMALFPIFECMSYAKSSAVAPYGIFRASPLGVNTAISDVYSDNLKLSRKSTAFSVGPFSASRIFLSQRSSSSSLFDSEAFFCISNERRIPFRRSPPCVACGSAPLPILRRDP